MFKNDFVQTTRSFVSKIEDVIISTTIFYFSRLLEQYNYGISPTCFIKLLTNIFKLVVPPPPALCQFPDFVRVHKDLE